jgi:hypothetical protein
MADATVTVKMSPSEHHLIGEALQHLLDDLTTDIEHITSSDEWGPTHPQYDEWRVLAARQITTEQVLRGWIK